MRISIQPAALADLRRGFHFYERKTGGLGRYFLDSLCSDIDSLELHGGIHSIHYGRFYRLLSDRFPFAVYYQLKGDVILVRAVLDLRRDPKVITGELLSLK